MSYKNYAIERVKNANFKVITGKGILEDLEALPEDSTEPLGIVWDVMEGLNKGINSRVKFDNVDEIRECCENDIDILKEIWVDLQANSGRLRAGGKRK